MNGLEKYIIWSDIEKSHNYQPDDLSQVFWWHVLLLSINKAKLALFGISLALQLLPLAGSTSCRNIMTYLKYLGLSDVHILIPIFAFNISLA